MIIRVARNNYHEVEMEISDIEGYVNLDGCEVKFKVVDINGDSVIEKDNIENGIEVVDSNTGKLEMDLTCEDTDIDVGTYQYEVLLIDGEEKYKVMSGELFIQESLFSNV